MHDQHDLITFLAAKVCDSQDSVDDLGLTRLVDLVSLLEKPLLTHNGMLDLMFLYSNFFEPLPERVGDFCARLNALFPHIYDTRHMLNTRVMLKHEFLGKDAKGAAMSLKDAYEGSMAKSPNDEIHLHPLFDEYTLHQATASSRQQDKAHEAGFDALMTGVLWYKS